MKIDNTKLGVICSSLLGLASVLSGCMYLESVNDVSSASQASLFGYNKELTINTDPQGAFVIIEEDGTYKTLGQTPLKYSVDLNGSNSYFKVTVARPGFHNQDVRIISGAANCYRINQSRRHLARNFFNDCFFLIPIPFNILVGLPQYASIPDEAFTCDYLGAKIVYAGEPIKLIPDNVALPVREIVSPQQIQAEREAEAARAAAQQAAALAMVNAAVQGINAGVTASNGGAYVPPAPVVPTISVVPTPSAASASSGGAAVAPGIPKTCPACYGNGRCRPCNGTGKNPAKKYAQGHLYDSAIPVNCRPCNGTGNCLTCGGKGHL